MGIGGVHGLGLDDNVTREQTRPTVRIAAVLAAVAALVWIDVSAVHSANARATCGDFYRIKRGDTLRAITVEALGHDRYAVLYRANRDILSSPAKIVVGQLIYVPCPDARIKSRARALAEAGRKPNRRDNRGDRRAGQSGPVPPADPTRRVTVISPGVSTKATVVRTAVSDTDQASNTPPRASTAPGDMLVLTASGLGYLSDETLPDGGLVSTIIREALSTKDTPLQLEPAFVDDRRAHLDVLMPTGAFALTYPWPAPECEGPAPGSISERLCQEFVFSRPLYEVEIVAFAAKASSFASVQDVSGLSEARICRPEGFPPVDLEAAGWPGTIVEARSAAKCLEMLREGVVDVLSVPRPWALGFAELGLLEITSLTSTVPIHAAAWKADPGAQATIARLDAGLSDLQQSGRWFSIVSAYLSAYNADQAARQ